MDSNRTATNLNTVHDHVVGFGADFGELLRVEQRHIISVRAREWMMDRVPFSLFGAELQEREIRHPKKIEHLGAGNRLQDFGRAQAQTAEHFAGDVPFIGRKKNQVAFRDFEPRPQRLLLRLGEEFYDGRFPFAVLDLDEGETFRAEIFRDRAQLIDLPDRD